MNQLRRPDPDQAHLRSVATEAWELVYYLETFDEITCRALDSNTLVVPIDNYIQSRDIRYQVNLSVLPVCEVHCDGAARGNGSYGAKAGYGVWSERCILPTLSVPFRSNLLQKPTNQMMELLAIKDALYCIWKYYTQCAARIEEPEFQFEIITDSTYSIDCLTTWYEKWERNGWTNSRGFRVLNCEIIQKCLAYKEAIEDFVGVPLGIFYVRGHSGNLGNTIADLLANMACDRQ